MSAHPKCGEGGDLHVSLCSSPQRPMTGVSSPRRAHDVEGDLEEAGGTEPETPVGLAVSLRGRHDERDVTGE